MAPKVRGIPTLGISGLPTPTWESRDKMPFGCWHVAKHKIYYKGEGGGFPQVRAMVSLVSPSLFVACLSTKSALVMH
jgi:hypothetical protein